jgi:hypothetical protein
LELASRSRKSVLARDFFVTIAAHAARGGLLQVLKLKKFGVAACWVAAVVVVGAVLLVPAAAQATPTFLSPLMMSDAGQDAYQPQVAEDPSGNVLMVWTRSDGSNLRIQARLRAPDGTLGSTATISTSGRDAYDPQVAFDPSGNAIAVWTQFDGSHLQIHAAFRPAGGSFGGDQTISPSGADANAPGIAVDSAGKAIAVWYWFDGTTDRIQAAVRPANGSFGTVQTLSPLGQEAYQPRIAAGPNADANAVAVWNGLEGSALRVWSARRRDVVGFPRPKGASPTNASLVPAFKQCTSANRTHGTPLSYGSCTPPVQTSSVLTIGSPDANGAPAKFTGTASYTAIAGNSSTETDEADVRIQVNLADIRNRPSLTDYTGSVTLLSTLQITDNSNAAETPEPGTGQPITYSARASCTSTNSTSVGSSCDLSTTADSIVPGTVIEGRRSIWELGQIQVKDAGPDGTPGNGDDAVFLRQGVYVP